MSEQAMVTAEELSEIPVQAVIAFAGRCARRVLALVASPEAQETMPAALLATEAAVRFVEGIAAADRPDESAVRMANVRLADVRSALDQYSSQIAIDSAPVAAMLAAANAVLAVANVKAAVDLSPDASASMGGLYPRKPNLLNAAETAASRAGYAAAVWAGIPENPPPVERAISGAMREDFERLKATADVESWDSNSPVPPEFFGPLWPNGEPPGWPRIDATAYASPASIGVSSAGPVEPDSQATSSPGPPVEDDESPPPPGTVSGLPHVFGLEIYIDPGDASKEAIQAVLESLSDLHRAAGGLGLEFHEDGLHVLATEEATR